MARRFGRFEVKNEMRDGGKIRPDDTYKQNGGKTSVEQQKEIIENANQVGFDDFDFSFEQDNAEYEERIKPEIEEKEVGIEAITKEETDRLLAGYRNTSVQGELAVSSFLGSQAKKLGVDKDELKAYLRQQEKSRINSPEKVLHYHRTSMESAKKILESGHLLNRANIQLNGGDISHLSGSSSANVQFTVDRYDENGQLQMSGYNSDRESGIGAASTDIVFIMGPELLGEESYDCFYQYPTVEKASIQECCATILAKNAEVLKQLQSILEENGIQVPTMLQEEFDRETILESLTNDKENAMEIEDESVTPKITHSDVEQELSEYYTDDITNDYLEAYLSEKISEIYGDRLKNSGIFNVRKFLDGKLNDFQGIESYKEIIEELESILEVAENVREQEEKEIIQDEIIVEETAREETTVEEQIREENGFEVTSINGKSIEELVAAYQNAGINKSDLRGARETLAKTKEEREQSFTHTQTQPNKEDFEGR